MRERRVIRAHDGFAGADNVTVAADGTAVAAVPPSGRIVLIRGESVIEVPLGGAPHYVKVADYIVFVDI